MPTFQIDVVTPAASNGAAFATIHTGSGSGIKINWIRGIVSTAAAAVQRAILTKATNTPVATTTVTPINLNFSDSTAAAEGVDTAWSTAPTVNTTNAIDSFSYPTSGGSGYVFSFDFGRELYLPASSWLVFWNAGSGAGPVLTFGVNYTRE